MCASAGGRGVDVAVLGSIARGLRPTAVPTHEYQPSSRLRCGGRAPAPRAGAHILDSDRRLGWGS
jgi:hypothetical protein